MDQRFKCKTAKSLREKTTCLVLRRTFDPSAKRSVSGINPPTLRNPDFRARRQRTAERAPVLGRRRGGPCDPERPRPRPRRLPPRRPRPSDRPRPSARSRDTRLPAGRPAAAPPAPGPRPPRPPLPPRPPAPRPRPRPTGPAPAPERVGERHSAAVPCASRETGPWEQQPARVPDGGARGAGLSQPPTADSETLPPPTPPPGGAVGPAHVPERHPLSLASPGCCGAPREPAARLERRLPGASQVSARRPDTSLSGFLFRKQR
ncbi:uncharacterized protein [Equus przewalskii]|uniref:Basic proline-rich protein-like n=1 Tax=Equus przewalskii TaxID=9798 RepID=A0ABM4NIP6_EQUPR